MTRHSTCMQAAAGAGLAPLIMYAIVVDLAPSHNDLFKPDNMLIDGGRLWLVDWEAAFQNDRYADLAVVANIIVTNE